jgi:riboflavin synthase
MFTGLVEGLGVVEAVRRKGQDGTRRLAVATGGAARLKVGASVAVNGVCLTVVARRAGHFEADLGPETLRCTTLGDLRPGDPVHIERPLRAGDPVGGHFVTGHVDGVGRVQSRRPRGQALELHIAVPAAVASLLVSKGSVAVDGVSLTVNRVIGKVFSVMVIPHTLALTSLSERRVSSRVNIEGDLVAKHIARLMKNTKTARVKRKKSIRG